MKPLPTRLRVRRHGAPFYSTPSCASWKRLRRNSGPADPEVVRLRTLKQYDTLDARSPPSSDRQRCWLGKPPRSSRTASSTSPAELDLTMLHRITDNLAGNALTFTDAGGTVTLRTCGPDEVITVEVEDAGISSEDDFSPTCSSRPLGATRPQGERAANWGSPSRNGRRNSWMEPSRWTVRRAWAPRLQSASHGERSARGRVGEKENGGKGVETGLGGISSHFPTFNLPTFNPCL